FALREEPGDVRVRPRVRLPRLDRPLETLEHVRRRRRPWLAAALLEGREKAGAPPRVTRDALLVDLHEERVRVAVGVDGPDVLRVTGGLALAPRGAARARPEVGHPARERLLHGRPVHPGHHEELAGVRCLDDGGEADTGELLMVAWMDRSAVEQTLAS